MSPSTIIPCLRYRDARSAIEWLCQTLGFEKRAVYENPDGTIAHAELVHQGGMIMLGSVQKQETEFGKLIKQPEEVGGFETQSPYIVVADTDAVYKKVKNARGTIVIDIKDQDYGSRDFSFRDPEGHLWNIGTYNPWATGS